jgi:hydrogenase maturation protein HypF
VHPERIVCDLHPDYLATRYAQQRAREERLPLIQVQHHHAHLAACLADHHWLPDSQGESPVIGLIFDGTGLGTDGAVWGGECLVGGYAGYQRRFHLSYVPLPGGDQAVRKPARMALAHLLAAGLEWEPDLPPVETLCADERTLMRMQIERKINTPLTSSMGRLFDAASALIGVRQKVTYEGQAAIELEAWVDPTETGSYPFDLRSDIIDPAPFWTALLDDWRDGTATPILAARIHNSVAQLCLELCQAVRSETGSRIAALSGGVWQNRFLLEQVKTRLEKEHFEVFIHHQVPANDGCIALGQVMVAAFQTMG